MATVGLAPGLSRKLKKALECRTDSPEKSSLDINLDFLHASESAQLALDRVEEEVDVHNYTFKNHQALIRQKGIGITVFFQCSFPGSKPHLAVCCLKEERPVLFKYCAEEGGYIRPWHQNGNLCLHCLTPDAAVHSGSTNPFFKDLENHSGKIEADLTFVLDRIFEGVCRPFKVRLEQVLRSQPSLISSYKLSNTLEFYNYTISDLIGGETALCKTLGIIKDATQKTFFEILKSRGEKLLQYPPLVAVDLSPPPAVKEGVSVLLEIIETTTA
ncbi:hypothetical protein SLEP1_g9316 [Rubroshorea leprosula]|uniref:Conserved Oligomeric Golgi complex subunit 6 C-terminal domain-containing protein n=1 Tax=Rubroshorea leprosula TaxID=152421 RepID=A0AAV5IEE4_9ROSI|nr:hypothetical protein SLEP1_g9316 [Rubroshorea leprosula]